MEVNLYYDVAALLVLIMISVTMGIKNDIKNKLYRLMLGIVALLLLSIATDTTCLRDEAFLDGMSMNMVKVYMSIYYISHVAMIILCSMCAVYIVGNSRFNKWSGVILTVPFAGAVALTAWNWNSGILFTIGKNKEVVLDDRISYMYGIMAVICAYTFFYVMFNHKKISKLERLSLYVMIAIQIGCGLTQLLFPELLIENFGYALSMIAVSTGVRNMEEVLDYTTQVYDKQAFFNTIRARLSLKNYDGKSRRKNTDFQIITVYLKNLQDYLDVIGIKYEDSILKILADFFKQSYPRASVYYLGEDAFGMIVRNNEFVFEEMELDKLNSRLEDPIRVGNYRIKLEALIQVLNLRPEELKFEDICEYVDYGFMKNITSKKNVYTKDDINLEEVRRNYKIMNILKNAVEHDGFEMAYQPIYSAKFDRIVSAEALIRLKDNDTLGYISPEEFIPVAEKGGLILKIGEAVLRKTCEFIGRNKMALTLCGVEYIEVNLSTIQCMDIQVDQKAMDLMKEYGVEPYWLNFEITETADISSIADVCDNISELQRTGINFSLDDYGSGNANINYILEIPFEIVKIDKFILWDAFHNQAQMAALESTVRMLHELGIKMVVEGIENEEYLEKMKSLGCEYFQGYYFSKPVSEEQYLEYCKVQNALPQ